MEWDDAGNNRAFLKGAISATNNGLSIYVEAKRKPENYRTETGAPLWQDTLHAPLPKGAGGQFNMPIPCTNGVMKYSKNQTAAKDFLRWINSKEVYGQWFTSQQGYCDGSTKFWEGDPVWNLDPVMLPFRDIPYKARLAGYAGPPGPASCIPSTSRRVFVRSAPCLTRTRAARPSPSAMRPSKRCSVPM